MLVYHASNSVVKNPMLVESNRLLDFGAGFYTTTNREQAIRFAESVVRKRGGRPILNIYEFDESGFDSCLLLRFEEPSGRRCSDESGEIRNISRGCDIPGGQNYPWTMQGFFL